MGREFELKYRSDAAAIAAIGAAYGNFSTIAMETTYYDTPDLKLRIRRWTLRRRMENERSVCTVKIPLPDGSRGEWEVESPNLMQGILKLCEAGAPMELLAVTASGIRPFCGAKFTRLAAMVEIPGGKVELALDQGVLTGGNKELPFAEVEVELKEGSEEAAIAFAQSLAKEFGLTPEPRSKVVRAMALAFG